MAVVKKKKLKKVKGTSSRPDSKTSPSIPKVTLPQTTSVPSNRLGDYTWLIYGRKKIGKTSLVSHFPKCLFMMFEPGGKALRILRTPTITRWEEVLAYVTELEKAHAAKKLMYRTICMDPGNKAYDLCFDYICVREGIDHPSEKKDYGATWKMIAHEFQVLHSRLAAMGLGFVVVAHSKSLEQETLSGVTYDQIVPRFSGQTEEFYEGVIDNIAYYHYVGARRYLQIRGDEEVVAGTRCEENFLTPSGEQVFRIPMGSSSKEAYDNIKRAFNNKQQKTYANVLKRAKEGGRKFKKKKLKKSRRDDED